MSIINNHTEKIKSKQGKLEIVIFDYEYSWTGITEDWWQNSYGWNIDIKDIDSSGRRIRVKASKDIMCSDVQNWAQIVCMMIKISRVSHKALNPEVQAKDDFGN